MADSWTSEVVNNELGVDTATDEFVLVTNGRCVLDHSTADAYAKAHTDGCRFFPCEGLVFVMEGDKLVSWQMRPIAHRTLRKTSIAEHQRVMPQYEVRCEEIRKGLPRKKKPK